MPPLKRPRAALSAMKAAMPPLSSEGMPPPKRPRATMSASMNPLPATSSSKSIPRKRVRAEAPESRTALPATSSSSMHPRKRTKATLPKAATALPANSSSEMPPPKRARSVTPEWMTPLPTSHRRSLAKENPIKIKAVEVAMKALIEGKARQRAAGPLAKPTATHGHLPGNSEKETADASVVTIQDSLPEGSEKEAADVNITTMQANMPGDSMEPGSAVSSRVSQSSPMEAQRPDLELASFVPSGDPQSVPAEVSMSEEVVTAAIPDYFSADHSQGELMEFSISDEVLTAVVPNLSPMEPLGCSPDFSIDMSADSLNDAYMDPSAMMQDDFASNLLSELPQGMSLDFYDNSYFDVAPTTPAMTLPELDESLFPEHSFATTSSDAQDSAHLTAAVTGEMAASSVEETAVSLSADSPMEDSDTDDSASMHTAESTQDDDPPEVSCTTPSSLAPPQTGDNGEALAPLTQPEQQTTYATCYTGHPLAPPAQAAEPTTFEFQIDLTIGKGKRFLTLTYLRTSHLDTPDLNQLTNWMLQVKHGGSNGCHYRSSFLEHLVRASRTNTAALRSGSTRKTVPSERPLIPTPVFTEDDDCEVWRDDDPGPDDAFRKQMRQHALIYPWTLEWAQISYAFTFFEEKRVRDKAHLINPLLFELRSALLGEYGPSPGAYTNENLHWLGTEYLRKGRASRREWRQWTPHEMGALRSAWLHGKHSTAADMQEKVAAKMKKPAWEFPVPQIMFLCFTYEIGH